MRTTRPLPAITILPGQLVGLELPAILFNETPVPLLAGQPRIHFEHFYGLAGDTAVAVDFLLGTPLLEHVAALALLVSRQACSHLRGKRVEVGQRPLLSERRGGEHQRNHQRTHDPIITLPPESFSVTILLVTDMRRYLLIFLAVCCLSTVGTGQAGPPPPPRLILVVSVDQMRFDFLERFAPLYRSGLKTLLERGAVFTNAKYRHAATETGPGHAILLTGSDPRHSGIVANDWWDPYWGRVVNVVDDPVQTPIGGSGRAASPANLLTFTVGDVLKSKYPARVSSASPPKIVQPF